MKNTTPRVHVIDRAKMIARESDERLAARLDEPAGMRRLIAAVCGDTARHDRLMREIEGEESPERFDTGAD